MSFAFWARVYWGKEERSFSRRAERMRRLWEPTPQIAATSWEPTPQQAATLPKREGEREEIC